MNSSRKTFAICLKNQGFEVSLETRKLYQVLPDPEAKKHHQIRIVDESGEDYLYPDSCFLTIDLSTTQERAVLAT
jgi:hypothetical protein